MPHKPQQPQTIEERLAELDGKVERHCAYVREVAPNFDLRPSLEARNKATLNKSTNGKHDATDR